MTTVLVTGANRGIGLELVRQYAADGAEVIACARDLEAATALSSLAREAGRRVRPMALDVTSQAMLAALKGELAGQPIDILINNAGVGSPRSAVTETGVDPDVWVAALRVNTIGPVNVSMALKPNVAASGDKKIVAITSGMGSTANNPGGSLIYRSTKAALNNAMRGLSREWAAEGVLVGILHPGWVRTDMGGPSAAVSVEDSVTGLRRRIADLDATTSGVFQDYRGERLPW
jgi:NAD(P)-dependent dehydrogenase (short-subunit alcohol dehydrogenase family)